MRGSSVLLGLLLVVSAGVWAVGQSPPPPGPPDHPPGSEAMMGQPDPPAPDDEKHSHGRWGRDKPMDEVEGREAFTVLRRIDPEKADRIQQAIEAHPDQIGRILQEQLPNLGRFMAWRRFDPDGFELRVRDIELSRLARESAERVRNAVDAGNDGIAAVEQALLEELVADHFDVRQQIREHELAKLKQRIEELLDQLQERTDKRQELIQQRMDELIHESTDERW